MEHAVAELFAEGLPFERGVMRQRRNFGFREGPRVKRFSAGEHGGKQVGSGQFCRVSLRPLHYGGCRFFIGFFDQAAEILRRHSPKARLSDGGSGIHGGRELCPRALSQIVFRFRPRAPHRELKQSAGCLRKDGAQTPDSTSVNGFKRRCRRQIPRHDIERFAFKLQTRGFQKQNAEVFRQPLKPHGIRQETLTFELRAVKFFIFTAGCRQSALKRGQMSERTEAIKERQQPANLSAVFRQRCRACNSIGAR